MKLRQIIFLLLLSFLFADTVISQSYSLEGYVQDSIDQKGIELASVLLMQEKDSVMIGFSITNKDGRYLINDIPEGNYILNVNYLGYREHLANLEIGGDTKKVLRNIPLVESSELLDQITIMADHVPIKINKDTVEYNANAFKTQPADNVEDLLRKLPGVEVDDDGTITAHGEEVEKVTVEGKQFFGDDPTIATRNLPADIVDKVQIFDQQSENAEFTGIDDGEREKTINLALKEGKKAGYFGNARGGYGSDDRYEGKFNINRFTPSLQLSTLGMLNNTNQQGFSFREYIGFMGGLNSFMSGGGGRNLTSTGIPVGNSLGSGMVNTGAGGVNFNFDLGDATEVESSVFYSRIENDIVRDVLRENVLQNQGFTTEEASRLNNLGNTISFNSRIRQKIDSTQNFTINLKGSINNGSSNGLSNTSNFDPSGRVQSKSLVENASEADKWNLNTDITYRKKLKKVGRFFTFGGGINLTNTDQLGDLTSSLQKNVRGQLTLEDILQDQILTDYQNSYQARISYTEPLGNKRYLEINMSTRDVDNEYDKLFYDLDPNMIDVRELNSLLSNMYVRDYRYHRLGSNLKWNRDYFSLTAGLSLQNSHLKGELQSINESIIQNYWYVLPSANLQYDISATDNFRMRYSTNINEPSLTQLQPIVDNTDPLNVYIGNPDLDPEYRHNLRLNYNTYSQFSGRGFFATLSGTYTKNKIINTRTIDEFFVQTTTPINVIREWNASSNLSFNTPVRSLKHNVRLSTSMRYTGSINFINEDIDNVDRLNNSFRITLDNRNKDVLDLQYGANIGLNYTAYDNNPALNQTFLSHRYFADIDLELGKEWVAGTKMNYTLLSNESFGENSAIPIWSFTLSKVFLESKKARIELAGFDLLNQNTSINRTSNINYIQEERVETIGMYFMLSLSYSFSGFGENGGGRGGSRGGRRFSR